MDLLTYFHTLSSLVMMDIVGLPFTLMALIILICLVSVQPVFILKFQFSVISQQNNHRPSPL